MSSEILGYLKSARRAAILPHISIDGDGLCSAYALKEIVKNYGGEAVVFIEEDIPSFLSFIGGDAIKWNGEDLDFDVAVAVDCGEISRLGERYNLFSKIPVKLNIDHHRTNTYFGDVNLVDADASSASEIVYSLIDFEISKPLAETIITGIITDTGAFRYSCTGAYTHEIAAKLMKAGADTAVICEKCFESKRLSQLKIESKAITDLQLYHGGKTAVAFITEKMLHEVGAEYEDVQAISSMLRTIEGVNTSVFAYEKNGDIKVSLRTDGVVDASKVCESLGGGGHARAAGVTMTGDIEKCLKMALEAVEKYY